MMNLIINLWFLVDTLRYPFNWKWSLAFIIVIDTVRIYPHFGNCTVYLCIRADVQRLENYKFLKFGFVKYNYLYL